MPIFPMNEFKDYPLIINIDREKGEDGVYRPKIHSIKATAAPINDSAAVRVESLIRKKTERTAEETVRKMLGIDTSIR
jgi:type IV pilus biogenesis protein CpaD/CtpE